MTSKKETVTLIPARVLFRELEFLYARRSAIDHLIDSLQAYDRCRGKWQGERKRKTA
jgi:hypothetical protein